MDTLSRRSILIGCNETKKGRAGDHKFPSFTCLVEKENFLKPMGNLTPCRLKETVENIAD
jgi:hypothetical protein